MIDVTYQPAERRPLASRDANLARRLTAWLVARNVSANAVSLSSIGFAALAALCLVETRSAAGIGVRALFAFAALFVQLRLLANLLDGMIAVSTRNASPVGELYNEVPDRAADILILVGAGFAVGGTPALGYMASLVAVLTAYVRALGNSVGVRGLFAGPMAKPQRMAAMTVACAYCAFAPDGWVASPGNSQASAIDLTLALIAAGGLLTAWRRLRRTSSELRGRR